MQIFPLWWGAVDVQFRRSENVFIMKKKSRLHFQIEHRIDSKLIWSELLVEPRPKLKRFHNLYLFVLNAANASFFKM